jgi:transcriptional regulator with XRE-family HTH domain
MNLSTKIRNARLNLSTKLGYQISQGEFSKMCGFGGTGQSRLSNYETGKRAPSLEDLLRIIAVSGASPKDFFDPSELEGLDLDHVNGAFKRVAEEASIPKNLFRTGGRKDIENAVESYIIDPACPLIDEDARKEYSVFYADRDSDIASKGDLIYGRQRSAKVSQTGWWIIQVGNMAVHDYLKVMPNGEISSLEFGNIESGEILVLGQVESVWKKI